MAGFQTKPAKFTVGTGDGAYAVEGEQIVRIGRPPFRIAHTLATVTVKNSHLTQAVVLDINGYPKAKIDIEDGRVTLPKDAVYVVLESK